MLCVKKHSLSLMQSDAALTVCSKTTKLINLL